MTPTQNKSTGWIDASEIASFIRWLEQATGQFWVYSQRCRLIDALKSGKTIMVLDHPDGTKEIRIR